MSRSNYFDGGESWDLIRWRGAVASAIRGKRGQVLLREMAGALDALEPKVLIAGSLAKTNTDGSCSYCALGAVGAARGLSLGALSIDASNEQLASNLFGVAPALVREIAFENDDDFFCHTSSAPSERWRHMRKWVAKNIAAQGEATT